MQKTREEMLDELDRNLPDGAEGRSRWPGMTYEQGVSAALLWAAGVIEDPPLTGN